MKYMCNLGNNKLWIFIKHNKWLKISTYNSLSSVKSPRLGGISPTSSLSLRFLFLFGDRAIERENTNIITQNLRVEFHKSITSNIKYIHPNKTLIFTKWKKKLHNWLQKKKKGLKREQELSILLFFSCYR